ncbi:MAG: D-alanyl-D-alanine carboxypeptidase family protein [Acidimicrobiales bacterium]
MRRLLHHLFPPLVLCVAMAVGATFASAQESPDELREQRREVQEDAAEAAGEVDALTDDVTELTVALDALRAAVDAQQSALDAAQRRVAAAETAEAAADAAITELETEIITTRDVLERSAVDAFIGYQGPNGDVAVLGANPWQHARTESLIEFGTGDTTEIIDELRRLGAELDQRRDDAAAYTAELEGQRAEVAARISELDAALAREQTILDEVEDRLDSRLAEVQALESLDAELAAEITAEEQRIAAEIAARSRPPSREGTVDVPDNAPVDLTTVRGIVVNSAIASNVEGFLAAMEARGYSLGGGGYRSSDSQVSLRRAHCGSSDYAIWEMPSSQCSPPTARPGRSAHERGLAIDFTYGGSIIRSRSSDVFQVMSEVAPGFGLINLPSEPWHWSTTGG